MEQARDYRDTIKARLARDPAFVDAMMDQFEAALAEIDRLEDLLKTTGKQFSLR